jgi:hypothetical protein
MNPTIVLPLSAATAAGHNRVPSLGVIRLRLALSGLKPVVPAKAGTQQSASRKAEKSIPAFAGMAG